VVDLYEKNSLDRRVNLLSNCGCTSEDRAGGPSAHESKEQGQPDLLVCDDVGAFLVVPQAGQRSWKTVGGLLGFKRLMPAELTGEISP
jgi:hypothetical protein